MKKLRLLIVVALSLCLAASLFVAAGCAGGGGSNAVAATVNGTNIMEQEITDTIEAMRSQSGDYSDPTAWATALAASGLTPESLRESVIESKARDIVLTQEAAAQGFEVDEDAIDAQVSQTRITVGADDDASWLEMLQAYGYRDEQAYRDMLYINDLTMQLYEDFFLEPTDEDLRVFIAQNPNAVAGFSLGGEEDAAVVPDEDGAEETEGTEGEEPGLEMPTDLFDPSDVNLSEIPADVRTQYEELWSQNNKGLAFQEWIQELVDSADIVINDMPENVPYNVDMSLAGTNNNEMTDENESDFEPTFEYSSDEAIASAISQGLSITDDVVGTGAEAVAGSTVLMHYVGTLDDGTEFDSNTAGDTPFSFTLGIGQVILGWDAGIVGMKEGGTRTLVIPAELAYGAAGRGEIPPNATLTFVVELVEVK